MKLTTYQLLLATALDLFKEELANRPEITTLLASGSDLSSDDDSDLWSNAHDVAEAQTTIVLPDDYPSEKLMTLLREDPSLIAAKGIGEHDNIRDLLIDVVRHKMRGDMLEELGISTGLQPWVDYVPGM